MIEPFFISENLSLYLGDCLSLLQEIDSASVDLIFADPPYFLSDGTITCQNGKMVSVKKGDWDEIGSIENRTQFHRKWIHECRRVLKPGGAIWISGTYHSIYLCGSELQHQGFRIINDICWYKPNAAPNLSRKCFTASHETLIWAAKETTSKQYFNYELMKNGVWDSDRLKVPGKQMRSVWAILPPSKSEKAWGKHPTQKPLALLERIILASSKEDDLVLDPFNGSGTTGIAAIKLKRRYIGIDDNEEYLRLTINRFRGEAYEVQ